MITATEEVKRAFRQKCQCSHEDNPEEYGVDRNDPDFESCFDYWGMNDMASWCDGCMGVNLVLTLSLQE